MVNSLGNALGDYRKAIVKIEKMLCHHVVARSLEIETPLGVMSFDGAYLRIGAKGLNAFSQFDRLRLSDSLQEFVMLTISEETEGEQADKVMIQVEKLREVVKGM